MNGSWNLEPLRKCIRNGFLWVLKTHTAPSFGRGRMETFNSVKLICVLLTQNGDHVGLLRLKSVFQK